MNKNKTDGTKIIVLGGLGEVGKNMYCVMHNDAIVIIDAGVSFPESELKIGRASCRERVYVLV